MVAASEYGREAVWVPIVGSMLLLLKSRRRADPVLLAAEDAMVSYSRMYVCLRNPLDVLAGALLAVSIALFGSYAIHKCGLKPLTAVSSVLNKIFAGVSCI